MRHPIHEHLERRRLYLFRHAEAINAQSGSLDYPSDVPLTNRGIEQAVRTHEMVCDIDFDFAVCSDYRRAQQTGEIILGDRKLELQSCEYFRELNADLKELIRDADSVDAAVKVMVNSIFLLPKYYPAVVDDGVARAGLALSFLLKSSWTTAMVSAHGAFNRVLMCHLLGVSGDHLPIFEQDYCAMNILDLDIDRDSNTLVRAVLRELNTTAYNPAKIASMLSDIETLAEEVRPLIEKKLINKI